MELILPVAACHCILLLEYIVLCFLANKLSFHSYNFGNFEGNLTLGVRASMPPCIRGCLVCRPSVSDGQHMVEAGALW